MTDTPTGSRPHDTGPGSSDRLAESEAATGQTSQDTGVAASDQDTPPPAQQEDLLARTRASETWVAIIVFAVVLILLLIFILENTKRVEISYFGATTTMPLAVAMLLAAVAGVLLTAIAGTLRILQLRHRVRKGQAAAR